MISSVALSGTWAALGWKIVCSGALLWACGSWLGFESQDMGLCVETCCEKWSRNE